METSEVKFIHRQIEQVREALYNFPDCADIENAKKFCLDNLDTLDQLLCIPANVNLLSLLLSQY